MNMNARRIVWGLWLGLAWVGGWAEAAESRAAEWKEVDEAMAKRRPETAVAKLGPIIEAALKEGAWGEAVKAIGRRIQLEAQREGGRGEARIRRMDAEIARAPAEMVPLLETIQANWFWQYFQQNQWRFMQRTATEGSPGDDFTTWDLPRLFGEIDRRFQRALAAEVQLQRIPLGEFDSLLERGNVSDRYRPTLFDFVAHEALAFYTSGGQVAAKPQDAFELQADGPIFDSLERFSGWDVVREAGEANRESPQVRALELYQRLIRFHGRDAGSAALVDVDLARLTYGWNQGVGESKRARYVAALRVFVDRWADDEVAALALYEWANMVRSDGDWVQARELAMRGMRTHPESPGGRRCYNLVQEIEAPSLSLATERVWNEPWPAVEVRYRNLTNAHFRVVAWDWNDFLQRHRSRPEQLGAPGEREELLNRKPVLSWSAVLPPTDDFRERVHEIAAPQRLSPGHYFLVASANAGFGVAENQVFFVDFWVSDLALVLRPHAHRIEGFVLDARTGDPLEGAEVTCWRLDSQGNRVPVAAAVRSDTNGFFTMPNGSERSCLVRVRYPYGSVWHELGTMQEWGSGPVAREPSWNRTLLFTDRALYRPGQPILFKGICFEAVPEEDQYRVLAGFDVTVVLRDVNGQEVARVSARSNDYGSFAGQFTAPTSGLMGQMVLQMAEGPDGQGWVRVEEYKRPKFQVTMDAPKTAARLGEEVVLTGKAESYTGAAVDDAEVRFRVVREVQWPVWWGWFRRPTPGFGASQEIAHGMVRTGVDGTFEIRFVARPDLAVLREDEPVFRFTVRADVTDPAGETRSSERAVRVGYTALELSLKTDEWQTTDQPVTMRVATRTLDGEPQVAEGVLRVHRLKVPDQVVRPRLSAWGGWGRPEVSEQPDASDPNLWELGEVVLEQGVTTGTHGEYEVATSLGAGVYRAVFEAQDRFGAKVTARLPLHVLDLGSQRLDVPVPHLVAAPRWSVEPGGQFLAVWGTGYERGRVFVEIEHRGQMLRRFWTPAGETQVRIEQAVSESMRGGFTLHLTRVQENRAYLEQRRVEVPWSQKRLEISWERIRSKLEPGQSETWTAVIKKRAGTEPDLGWEPAVAEMVATLYDASLDAFLAPSWPESIGRFRQDQPLRHAQFENVVRLLQHLRGNWSRRPRDGAVRYRGFPSELQAMGAWGSAPTRRVTADRAIGMTAYPAAIPAAPPMALAEGVMDMAMVAERGVVGGKAQVEDLPAVMDLEQVSARKNLQETAAFFPQLVSGDDGVVRFSFTMPEALTTWRFLGLAHDRELRSGFLEGKTVTAKDLMVQPNPPRFLREGDELEFTVRVMNQSEAVQRGKVQLSLRDALTEAGVDAVLGNRRPELEFEVPAKESRTYGWRLRVPDGTGFLVYRAVASSGSISDGEEGHLPVLSRRIFLTESLPLPIRGPGTRVFRFEKLLESAKSNTLEHQGVTVQMVSNPAWYAVMALPYLMEFPHECSEQVFNRFYANSLARFIAMSDPKIRSVFDQWRDTPALESPLEKNQELKAVMIEETPWLRQSRREGEARRNVGFLFEAERLGDETDRALRRLREMQLGDGRWPWFTGGPANDYLTLYIVTGFGRLRHLGADVPVDAAVRALGRLDTWITGRHERILEGESAEAHVPDAVEALYLYGRSFFLQDQAVAPEAEKAARFFLEQGRRHWTKVGSRQAEGHLALALRRWGGEAGHAAAREIMVSLKERSVTDDELGRFWRDTELSWWWYRAPIETQALMIEAFDEIAGDAGAVEELKIWLLKQKQTQDWKTTKATADAVYALLLRGTDLLASTNLVEVTVGGVALTPAGVPGLRGAEGAGSVRAAVPEAGTGFYERRFSGAEVRPGMGEVTVRKVDAGVAWGSIHWQYLEDMSRVTPHTGTPLKLAKRLYIKRTTPRGPELTGVQDTVGVGDELVVRLELRVDRDMEYVHLKDQRASGTEPVNVLSRYRYQDGLAYYESTRDTASHFFIDYLPKGVYVFEYSTRVQHRGLYQTGVAEIQCMYAPEFNSHSESLPLRVR
jgi:hypothetical protein